MFACGVLASIVDFRWALFKYFPCNPVILVSSLIRFEFLNEDLPLKKIENINLSNDIKLLGPSFFSTDQIS